MRTAAIGIGSNSLRMLIADLSEGKLKRLKRYREGLRVFAALDAEGNIRAEMIENACSSVRAFRDEALKEGAQTVHLFATSAVRDAANQQAFAQALYDSTQLTLEVCSGEEEAQLSFWGAAEGEGETGLIDIGGGSTEIAVGNGRRIEEATSLQMGAVRFSRLYPITDVETAQEVIAKAREVVSEVKKRFATDCAVEWTGVGGTFTTCAALVQRIPWQKREFIHGYVLTKEALMDTIAFLAPMPMEERLKLECLQPQRADIVVHGIAILLACMLELNISQIKVSEYGNLEGYLKRKYLFGQKV